jgi:hypothetical protein
MLLRTDPASLLFKLAKHLHVFQPLKAGTPGALSARMRPVDHRMDMGMLPVFVDG